MAAPSNASGTILPAGETIQYDLESEQCIVCGKQTTFCCSRCRRVFYCSQACQRIDWRSHKLTCRESVPADAHGKPFTSTPSVIYDIAAEALKTGLLTRYGSIVAAYEWFDSRAGGYINFSDFEGVLGPSVGKMKAREWFSALDKDGDGRVSLSEFLDEAVKKLNIKDKPSKDEENRPLNGTSDTPSKEPTDPSRLPPTRRALRAAALLAFRNGRYDDAIVSSQQALGLTSLNGLLSKVAKHYDNLVELLLLGRSLLALSRNLKEEKTKVAEILGIISEILPVSADSNTTPVYPSHVQSTLLCAIADMADQVGGSELAHKYYLEYLRLVQEKFGADSLPFGDALTVVGAFFLKTPLTLEKAIDCTQLARDIRKKQLPTNHARVADSYVNLGIALKKAKRFEKSIEQLEKGLEIRTALYGPSNLLAADVQYSVAASCIGWAAVLDGTRPDLIAKATEQLQYCHATRASLLGNTHKETLLCADALAKVKSLAGEEGGVVGRVPVDLWGGKKFFEKKSTDTLPPPVVPLVVAPVVPLVVTPDVAPSVAAAVTPLVSKLPPPSVSSVQEVPSANEDSHFKSTDGSSIPDETTSIEIPTLFSDIIDQKGQSTCVQYISAGDPQLFSGIALNLADHLGPPVYPPDWILNGAELAYLRKCGSMELETDGDPKFIESFFKQIKIAQERIKQVFSLLNSINRNVNGETSPLLDLSTFSSFVNSKTANVDLVEYFADTMSRHQPQLLRSFIDDLSELSEIAQISLKDFLLGLQAEFKSLEFVCSEFNERVKAPAVQDTSPAALVARECIRLRLTAADIKLAVGNRIRTIAEGAAVLVDAFQIPQNQIIEKLDTAIDALMEFYSLLKKSLDEEESASDTHSVPDESPHDN